MQIFNSFDETKILSVDDDAFNQELALAIFDDYDNITILAANNGKEALALLETEAVDLILLDLMMPEMNGFDTLMYLKSHAEYRDIPVVVVTSKEEEKRKTYQIGADDFISKPYNPEELKLRVYNHLRIKKFTKLLDELDTKVESQAGANLPQLKEIVSIAIGSQKKLLEKLGNLASHEQNTKDIHASKRLGEYAKIMAQLNGLNSKEIDNLYYAMSIYDVGLLRITQEYRSKKESKEFQQYPLLGLDVLDDLEETTLISMSKEIILTHQEHWNGKGFPNGLKGEEISFYGRIAGLIDFFDELTTARVYSPESIGCVEALEMIQRESGIKLDPNLVRLFSEHFEEFREVKNKWNPDD